MNYSRQISTGRLIRSCTKTPLETLLREAISNGALEGDVEVGTADDMVVQGWLAEQMELDKTYSEKRKESYPPATDYLDGIVKGDQAQIDKYIADCLAVKQRHPK
mgnify:CR=1 FL=1|jgi:hypothetical protein